MYREPPRDEDAALLALAEGSADAAAASHAARVRRALVALGAGLVLLASGLAWGAHASQRAPRAFRDRSVGTRTVAARAVMVGRGAAYQTWVRGALAQSERLERGCREALFAATAADTEIRACEGPVCLLCREGRAGPMKKVTAFIEP